MSIGNDIYLYTGVTSANADESNLGFILENMRTGEITKYSLASMTEESARESAEGAVQEKSYKATFPILINLNDNPLYHGLEGQCWFGQRVRPGRRSRVPKCYRSYYSRRTAQQVRQKTILKLIMKPQKASRGVVADLKSAVIKGDTVYFFKVDGKIYKVKASVSDDLPLP